MLIDDESNNKEDINIRELKKEKKVKNNKKVKKGESLEDQANKLISLMRNYYENDIRMLRSNIRGELLRIKHVNDITSKMFNINLQEILLQKNVLYEIKLWLEPLPDKSLPNIKIKKQLLELLNGMNLITKNDLLKSDIGKIVNFYAQNMKESYEVRSLASSIIKKWKLVVIKEERS